MFWHYTSANNYISIANDGLILPATTYVPVGEKPIVWFSTEQFWEPTSAKACHRPDGTLQLLTLDGMLKRNILPIRIGVDSTAAPYRWSDLKSLSRMSSETARSLASSAKRMGAHPSRWRGTFEAVCVEKWRTIEYYNGREWAPLEYKNPVSPEALERTGESLTCCLPALMNQ